MSMAVIVGVCGIDGTGKTTAAKLAIKQLEARGIRAHYRHELDFAGVKLLVRCAGIMLGKRRAEGLKEGVLVSKERNKFFVSFMYHLLVWLDSLAAYVSFKFRRGVVIHDRWPYDFLIQFKLRQYKNRIIWNLFKRFPRPDVLILLKVPYYLAYERKRTDPAHLEDGPEFFLAQSKYMDEIGVHFRYDRVISSERPAEEVAREIVDFVIEQAPSLAA